MLMRIITRHEEGRNSFHFVLVAEVGRMNQRRQHVIQYRREENRVLREQLGGRGFRFNILRIRGWAGNLIDRLSLRSCGKFVRAW